MAGEDGDTYLAAKKWALGRLYLRSAQTHLREKTEG
jgi:hypothetical protein